MTNRIQQFMHCRACIAELPAGESPETWARLSVGFTKEGLQIWCARHNRNVYDMHFNGQKMTRLPDDYDGRPQ